MPVSVSPTYPNSDSAYCGLSSYGDVGTVRGLEIWVMIFQLQNFFFNQFALIESASVDDDLVTLKKELSGGTMKGELPPGRTPVTSSSSSSSSSFPFQDSEIEKELNGLRRKAKDF
ncbi:hypothetical protein ACH5RR_016139 [Cinchona calisaya]|uniref:Uncharacterized protein n=1 Tax=Cinchona calisaya TaxID=153742 RepID=A0ABD2ZYI6_9GENT